MDVQPNRYNVSWCRQRIKLKTWWRWCRPHVTIHTHTHNIKEKLMTSSAEVTMVTLWQRHTNTTSMLTCYWDNNLGFNQKLKWTLVQWRPTEFVWVRVMSQVRRCEYSQVLFPRHLNSANFSHVTGLKHLFPSVAVIMSLSVRTFPVSLFVSGQKTERKAAGGVCVNLWEKLFQGT